MACVYRCGILLSFYLDVKPAYRTVDRPSLLSKERKATLLARHENPQRNPPYGSEPTVAKAGFMRQDLCAQDLCAQDLCAQDLCAQDLCAQDLCARRDWNFGDAAFYRSKVSWRCR
jgi:hypothetical protein